jgi:hypothetical protein
MHSFLSYSPFLQQLGSDANLAFLAETIPFIESEEHLHTLLLELSEYLEASCPILLNPLYTEVNLDLLHVARLAEFLLMPDEVLDAIAAKCIRTFLLSDKWSTDLFTPTMESRVRAVWKRELDVYETFLYYDEGPCEYEERRWHNEFLGYRERTFPTAPLMDPFGATLREIAQEHIFQSITFFAKGWKEESYSEEADKLYSRFLINGSMYTEFEALRERFRTTYNLELHPVPACPCPECYDIRMYCFHYYNNPAIVCKCDYCRHPVRTYGATQLNEMRNCMKLPQKQTIFRNIHADGCICSGECEMPYG